MQHHRKRILLLKARVPYKAGWLSLLVRGALLCTVFFVFAIGFAQKSGGDDRRTLEAKQRKLKEQIAYNQKLLVETRRNRDASLGEINLLNNLISRRKELLRTIDSEIGVLNRQLADNEHTIEMLEAEVKRLKAGYARLIYLSYKLRASDDRLLYLFASESFNQAWQRVRFLQQTAANRRRMYARLQVSKEEMESTSAIIKNQLVSKVALKSEKHRESMKLVVEKDKKGSVLGNIRKQEDRILIEIKRQQKESGELDAMIRKIIQEEIARAASLKKEGSKEAKKISDADIELSGSFSANKGKLPLPLEKGTISSTFGAHKHPDFDVYTENNGIDMLTGSGATARAVFEGVVSEVIQLPSYYAVLIKHGEYFTLYSKLQSVFVKKGKR